MEVVTTNSSWSFQSICTSLKGLLYLGTNLFFFGLCYSCNNYGHKVIDCKAYAWNQNTLSRNGYENSSDRFEGNYVRNPCGAFDINYNRFGSLNYKIECYKCNNFGQIDRNYRSRFTSSSGPSKKPRKIPKQ